MGMQIEVTDTCQGKKEINILFRLLVFLTSATGKVEQGAISKIISNGVLTEITLSDLLRRFKAKRGVLYHNLLPLYLSSCKKEMISHAAL